MSKVCGILWGIAGVLLLFYLGLLVVELICAERTLKHMEKRGKNK